MSKLKKKRKPPANAQFQVGGRVRVRHGNVDEDYPDMPLGGWVGTITEIHKDGMATVRWSRETLSAIHPIYAKRCERDGTRVEEYWIEEKDLEPDPGGPLEIEQPLEIRTDPLDPKDQDDRIRMVFGLTSNDPLPAVDVTTSRTFYEHLRNHLVFPFEAEYTRETGPFDSQTIRVKVTGFDDPDDEELLIDDLYGIFCQGRHGRRRVVLPLGDLDVKNEKTARQLIEDYSYWFWNYG